MRGHVVVVVVGVACSRTDQRGARLHAARTHDGHEHLEREHSD